MKKSFLIFLLVAAFASNALARQSDDLEFRKILTGFLANRTPEQMSQILYATPRALTVTPSAQNVEDFMTDIDEVGQGTWPQTLFEEGKEIAKTTQPYNSADLYERLRKQPVTLVIFPGVFSEFIDNRAFEEIFQMTDSTAAREWRARIASLVTTQCQAGAGDACDKSYDLSHMTLADGATIPTKVEPLDQYLSVASIDDGNKQPLIRVVLFRTEALSLETEGSVRENSVRFTRRLEKYFRLTGTPRNIAFIGYSRGAMVALDTLSYNYSQRGVAPAWLKNVKGMISLGGVNYGTALADDAFDPATTNGKLLAGLQSLLTKVQNYDDATLDAENVPDDYVVRPAVRATRAAENVAAESKFLALVASSSDKSFYDTVTGLSQQLKGTDAKAALRLMIGLVKNVADFKGTENISGYMAVMHRRLNKICNEVIDSVREMQTGERLKWWATNTVPLNMRYYALAGVMGDGLTDHKEAFNPDSADDRMLIGDYDDYYKASGVFLNDSQVAIERVRFWPKLNAMLNPKNAGMKSEFLGVVGTHHWGLALAIVNVNSNRSMNPFPRVALIKALATKVASDVISDQNASATVAPK